MKDGAILIKIEGNIAVLAIDSYHKLESQFKIYKEIAGNQELKLVRVAGYNIESLKYDQDRLNSTFQKEFE